MDEESAENQKATTIDIFNGKKRCRKSKVKETDNSSDCSECDEGDEVAAEEADDFFDASAPVMDTENVDQFRFDPHLWKINELPVQPTVEFLGVSGPLHQLSSTSGPFEFFCLFIPIFWWDRWATYTNQKANGGQCWEKKTFLVAYLCR